MTAFAGIGDPAGADDGAGSAAPLALSPRAASDSVHALVYVPEGRESTPVQVRFEVVSSTAPAAQSFNVYGPVMVGWAL